MPNPLPAETQGTTRVQRPLVGTETRELGPLLQRYAQLTFLLSHLRTMTMVFLSVSRR